MDFDRPILCLDFDGVLCDSAGELAMSGWGAMADLWPDMAKGSADDEFVERFRRLRPVIETGFQSILLARLIVDGVADDLINSGFTGLCDELMDRLGFGRDDLITSFGGFRDRWIARDLRGWLAPHRMYPGIVEALNRWVAEDRELYILSTREKRFILELLDDAGAPVPEDRIYGLESISKLDRLELLIGTGRSAPVTLVEDRIETLFALCERDGLNAVEATLADWGYNTAAERAAAAAHPRIETVTLDAFSAN